MPKKFESAPESNPEKKVDEGAQKLYKKVLAENRGKFDRKILNHILDTDPDYRLESKDTLYKRVMSYQKSIKGDLNKEEQLAKQKREEGVSTTEHARSVEASTRARIERENRISREMTGGETRRRRVEPPEREQDEFNF